MIAYDIETFPNCFLLCAQYLQTGKQNTFEISDRCNDHDALRKWLLGLRSYDVEMVGFNNIGFDYPVLHFILTTRCQDPKAIYDKAMSIINSQDRFTHLVKPSDYWVKQIDLFKIHHFDNKARTTSLKALEFNMRLPNIAGLPFDVGSTLTPDQISKLTDYCFNDVAATIAFAEQTKQQIAFRRELSKRYNFDFMNCADVKIGKDIFRIELEKAGITCYDYSPDTGRTPRQTPRTSINLADCIPQSIVFHHPEFNQVLETLKNTTITETKGALKDLTATVDGLEFVFGTGGLHASVENMTFKSNDEWAIYDVDVTSLYPSLAIEGGYYPEHLGPKFVDVYRQLREQRITFPKGSSENAMLKLALNGVYGASNDKFSIFYDPLFTMKITISGQLELAMLAGRLLDVPSLKIIQVNTDGITLYMKREYGQRVNKVCGSWTNTTGLMLEHVEFDTIAIADVNSYIARTVDGKIKRKGRYEYCTEWHQNASALVVPKVAEQVILEGKPIAETVRNWPDKMDFMIRAKVPRGSRLIGEPEWLFGECERLQRYYVSTDGPELIKIMPPLPKAPDTYRRIAIQKSCKVCLCNDMCNATAPIDYGWYINEVEKLVLGVL